MAWDETAREEHDRKPERHETGRPTRNGFRPRRRFRLPRSRAAAGRPTCARRPTRSSACRGRDAGGARFPGAFRPLRPCRTTPAPGPRQRRPGTASGRAAHAGPGPARRAPALAASGRAAHAGPRAGVARRAADGGRDRQPVGEDDRDGRAGGLRRGQEGQGAEAAPGGGRRGGPGRGAGAAGADVRDRDGAPEAVLAMPGRRPRCGSPGRTAAARVRSPGRRWRSAASDPSSRSCSGPGKQGASRSRAAAGWWSGRLRGCRGAGARAEGLRADAGELAGLGAARGVPVPDAPGGAWPGGWNLLTY